MRFDDGNEVRWMPHSQLLHVLIDLRGQRRNPFMDNFPVTDQFTVRAEANKLQRFLVRLPIDQNQTGLTWQSGGLPITQANGRDSVLREIDRQELLDRYQVGIERCPMLPPLASAQFEPFEPPSAVNPPHADPSERINAVEALHVADAGFTHMAIVVSFNQWLERERFLRGRSGPHDAKCVRYREGRIAARTTDASPSLILLVMRARDPRFSAMMLLPFTEPHCSQISAKASSVEQRGEGSWVVSKRLI